MAALRSWLTCFPIFQTVFLTSLCPVGLSLRQSFRPSKRGRTNGDTINGAMLNSCICKVDGRVFNLTETGKRFFDRPISFPKTKYDYFYLISICYPFSHPANDRGFSDMQPACKDASLCQMDTYAKPRNQKYYKLVTDQEYKNGKIKCYLNRTTGQVHWVYKGIPPLFKNAGLKLTLNCSEHQSEEGIKGVQDFDRRKSKHPWKFVTVTHKCCCADKCYIRPVTTAMPVPTGTPATQKQSVYLEIGEYGGGFLVLVLLMLVGITVVNRIYKRQSVINFNRRDYYTFPPIPRVPVRTIDYSNIENVMRIGEGTFGVVSKGIWNQTPVAVKRFKDHVIEEGITSVIREITCLSQLAHSNIVQFYGICNLHPNICIVTEYMPKGSVANVIYDERQVLTWDTRITWATHAARGMVFLHANEPQIIHRDLKSYNLLVNENDVVKIADFGTIKLVRPNLMMPNTGDVQGLVGTPWAGTLRWTAPESISIPSERKIVEYTTKSDVFSFAMTFWEMLYNKHPYHDRIWDKEIMNDILGGIRPDLPDCPEAVVSLLESWWHMNPDMRPEFNIILSQLQSETLKRAVTHARPHTI